MKLLKQILLLGLLALAAGRPSWAQVEMMAARTKGLSCGACGAIVEVYLRRLPGVAKVAMSISKEILQITYKPGAGFQPWEIRDALDKSAVDVLQFQISARGHVQEKGGKRYFLAGKDQFLLLDSPAAPNLPSGSEVSIEGIVNDHHNPMELKILTVKPPK